MAKSPPPRSSRSRRAAPTSPERVTRPSTDMDARVRRRALRLTEQAAPPALARVRGGIDGLDAESANRAVLENLIRLAEADPALVAVHRPTAAALAAKLGGDVAFRWHLLELRAAVAAPEAAPGGDSGDWIRERYGELVDRHRAVPLRIEALRTIGDRIRELEKDGVLPSALVVRSQRAPRSRRPTRT